MRHVRPSSVASPERYGGPMPESGERRPPDAPLENRSAWLLAVAAAAANFVTFGTLFSFGVFQKPIAEALGTSTGPTAALFSLAVCAYYFAGAVGGRLADRFGVRPVLLAAGVLLPVGLILSSRAESLWQLYLFYVPMVGTAVGCCYPPLIGAVGRRFERHRALAIAIVLLGVGAGTTVMPNVSELLEHAYGWRTTFVVLGVCGALVIALVLVAAGPAQKHESKPSPLGPIVRSPRFRRLYLSVVLVGPGFYTPLAFYNDYAVDHGIGRQAAAALIGLVGGSSVAARLVFGWQAGRLGSMGLGTMGQYRLGYALMLVGLAVWLVAGSSYPVLVASAVLHGIGWASWVTATPLVLTEWFGVRDLGGVIGTFYTGLGIGALAGPAVAGFLIERSGYRPAVATVTVTTLLACVIAMLPVAEGRHQPRTNASRTSLKTV